MRNMVYNEEELKGFRELFEVKPPSKEMQLLEKLYHKGQIIASSKSRWTELRNWIEDLEEIGIDVTTEKPIDVAVDILTALERECIELSTVKDEYDKDNKFRISLYFCPTPRKMFVALHDFEEEGESTIMIKVFKDVREAVDHFNKSIEFHAEDLLERTKEYIEKASKYIYKYGKIRKKLSAEKIINKIKEYL